MATISYLCHIGLVARKPDFVVFEQLTNPGIHLVVHGLESMIIVVTFLVLFQKKFSFSELKFSKCMLE